jgi:hypothetical protein
MKHSFWKWFGVVLVGLPIGCYTAFVAKCYWNWFAAPVLHVSNVPFPQMLGILWLIQVITGRPSDNDGNRWVLVLSIVELCVPPEKQAALEELKAPNTLAVFVEGFSKAIGQIASNTLMLALGFALHLFT